MHQKGNPRQTVAMITAGRAVDFWPKPVDVLAANACFRQNQVDSSTNREKEKTPHKIGNESGHRPGKQHERAEEPSSANLLIENEGQPESQDELEYVRHDHERDGVADRLLKAGRFGEISKVVQANEFAGIAHDSTGERDDDRIDERIGHQSNQKHNCREHQQVPPQRIPAGERKEWTVISNLLDGSGQGHGFVQEMRDRAR